MAAPIRVAAIHPADALGHPRQEAFQRALQTLVGETLPARVMARLADGGALVRVADATVRMALPATIAQDAAIALKLVAATPRPTFQLGTHADGSPLLIHADAVGASGAADGPDAAAPQDRASASAASTKGPTGTARSAAVAVPSGLPPAGPLPAHAGSAGTNTSLSTAARLIGSALALAPAAAQQALHPAAPLLGGADVSAPRIAAALHQAVESSGLFYESHLADWSEGRRALDSLRSEPQMRQASSEEPAALKLVAQQLASHEQQQVAWQGQLVPDVPFEWRISHDPPGSRGSGEDETRVGEDEGWHSRLRLQFALLGEVEASLSLQGGVLQVRLQAASPETEERLRMHGATLETAFGAAGLALSGLSVGSSGEPE